MNNMENENSILDKIIHSKQEKDAYLFNAQDLVSEMLNNLSQKEREVIVRRFSLDGAPKQTLEEIGKTHSITRERIRQIQSSAIKKIKDLRDIDRSIETFLATAKRVLANHGGAMEEDHFLDELLVYAENTPMHRQSTKFVISQLLDDHVVRIRKGANVLPGWKLKTTPMEVVDEILYTIHDILEKQEQLLKLEEIISHFKSHEYFTVSRDKVRALLSSDISDDEMDDDKIGRVILAHLTIGRKLDKNILDEWGFVHWPTVVPKRMGDKIYLILKKEGKPMHFTAITTAINDANFDKKVAYPATIHNELILDSRFVLVGRGIYALKEWGYEKGTVADVIEEILKKSQSPLHKEAIVNAVSEKRLVKKSTIYLALTNKNRFRKEEGGYTVA